MKYKLKFFLIASVLILLAAASDLFLLYQLNQYQTRFLKICGEGQNGYVKAVFEDNVLAECRNSMRTMFTLSIVFLAYLSMAMFRKIIRQKIHIARQEACAIRQNQQIAALKEQLECEYAFSARKHVFQFSVLDKFLEALDEKGVCPLHFALFEAKSRQEQQEFLEHTQVILNNQVLRFLVNERQALVIFAGYERKVSEKVIEALKQWKVHGLADLYCENKTGSYKEQFYTFWEGVSGTWEKKKYTGNIG